MYLTNKNLSLKKVKKKKDCQKNKIVINNCSI